MAAVNQPDGLGLMYADLERRLRDLENAPRVGLNLLRAAWGTAAADPSTFGAFEYGTVGNTWADDKGAVGTGYPTITLVCPARILIIASARPLDVASLAATYRCAGGEFGVAIDGVALGLGQPNIKRAFGNGNNLPVNMPMISVATRTITPGSHTFAMVAFWNDSAPAALQFPRLTDTFLAILPLTAA